jgi:hypothetical protein
MPSLWVLVLPRVPGKIHLDQRLLDRALAPPIALDDDRLKRLVELQRGDYRLDKIAASIAMGRGMQALRTAEQTLLFVSLMTKASTKQYITLSMR